MQVSSAAFTTTAGNSAGSAASTTPPSQQFDFMKLIVAQMKNLNPMDSSSGSDSLPTMMQAEELNQLTTLNKSIKDLQTLTQTGFAANLLGKTVSGSDGTSTPVTGVVIGMHVDASGPSFDLSGGRTLRMLDLTQVTTA